MADECHVSDKNIIDHNVSAKLNGQLRPIQKLDTTSEWGRRNMLISQQSELLQGFNLNRKNVMESIIHTDFTYTLNRDLMSAKIMVPALLPNINFFNPSDFPLYLISSL
jgi:hypothetical protein